MIQWAQNMQKTLYTGTDHDLIRLQITLLVF